MRFNPKPLQDLTGQPVLAPPLEAAVLVAAAAAFEYLTSRGAGVTPELSCLARDIGARAVPRLLANAPACPPGHALQTLLDRP